MACAPILLLIADRPSGQCGIGLRTEIECALPKEKIEARGADDPARFVAPLRIVVIESAALPATVLLLMASLLLVSTLVILLVMVFAAWIALSASRVLRRRWLLFWLNRATAMHARLCGRERADYDCARQAARTALAEAEARQKGRLRHIEDLTKSITKIEDELRDAATAKLRREMTQRQTNGS